jgi:Fe2+ or Zn2+ uptake regulation protein
MSVTECEIDCECSECCEHAEHDHFVCLDCGTELDPGAYIDRAMDYFEER